MLLRRCCGENHPPPAQGEQPTCQPACIVGHNTGSRNCKFRLIKKNQQAASHANLTPNQKDSHSTLAGHQSRSNQTPGTGCYRQRRQPEPGRLQLLPATGKVSKQGEA
ncbi:hypothetical protein HPB47_018843 [Ixodes persulcatus]|uniref:Uncharacterized protein n=1 Tax=Ixodes persulcatus TaxID=34615 RepID=A0AC60QNB5_IXOPE|nr:hypothetical protein HPB47_018843 [Ixodes persulcatus]